MKLSIRKFAIVCACLALALALITAYIQSTSWWAGYNLQNCPGCEPTIDWSQELSHRAVTPNHVKFYRDDGVLILKSVITPDKVKNLSSEVDSMPDTFMTTVIAKFILRQYSKYEHKLDTRSATVRDWAIHGPLATWAAQLMGVSEARLYNAEKIYSAGATNPQGCQTAWHRDIVAAPFPASAKSITINVYLDDINADGPNGDALIYMKGSHKDLQNPPDFNGEGLFEPDLKVGDILAHDPNIYHTPSGKGCWNRRSLQFRYVESPTTFQFGPNRFPHGPIPWTLAHASGIAPHGLNEGDALEGPWYPKVYPMPLMKEHRPLQGKPWSISGMLGVASQATELISKLGIGNVENCTIDVGEGDSNKEEPSFYGFDGPVMNCVDWELVSGLPVHKNGQMIKSLLKMTGISEDK